MSRMFDTHETFQSIRVLRVPVVARQNINPGGKETFASLVKKALKMEGVSAVWVADQLRVEPATFRTWLSRNTIPEKIRSRLLTMLNFDVPEGCELTARSEEPRSDVYRFSVAGRGLNLAATLQRADDKRRSVDAELRRLADAFPGVLNAMGRGDLSVFTSATVTPVEQKADANEELTQAMANAIYREATLLYVRPSAHYLRQFGTWKFGDVPDDDEVRDDFKRMRIRLQTVLAKGEYDDDDVLADLSAGPVARPPLTPSEANRRLDDHLLQIRVDKSPFWAAGFAMGLLHTRDLAGRAVRRMTVRVPGTDRVLLQPADYPVFVDRFVKFLLVVTRSASNYKNTDWPDQATQEIIDRIRECLSRGGASE